MSTPGDLQQLQQSVAGLYQQLAELQDQVSGLSSQMSPETLQPNYLTTDPSGAVGAAFTGFVKALGLELPTFLYTGQGTVNSTLGWRNPESQYLDASLITERQETPGGGAIPAGNYFEATVSTEAPAEESVGQLAAVGSDDNRQATLYVSQSGNGTAASVEAVAGSEGVVIIDQNGGSTFTRAAEQATVEIASLTPGSTITATVAVTMPPSWCVVVNLLGQTAGCTWAITSSDASSFEVSVRNVGADTASGSAVITLLQLG